MSLKNCLLFQLARGVYQKLPNGWSTTSKKKEVRSVLKEILGVPVRLIDDINIAELVSGISLSDTLFLGPIYIPSSTRNIPKGADHNRISNFVSLGAEIAGLDISNCTLDSILVCGTPETTLKSQGLSLDASVLSNAVFAFTNLHGLSCRGTQFNDVLMRNCSIELASFIDYRISRSLSICNDTPGMITPLRQSVFSCIEPQPEDHEFVLSRIVFDQCLILGYFEPTHLFGVTFQDCQFGDTGQYSQPSDCIIKGGASSRNDWEFHQSLFSKCNFENLHDSLYFRNCCEVKTIFFRDCQVKDMIFETPSNLDKMTITIEASTFENFVLTAEKQTASKKLPQIMIDAKDLIKPAKAHTSIINNPDLANIEIIGALDRLTISVDKDRTGSLRNCVITCKILTKSFLKIKGNLILKKVSFLGTPEDPIILNEVDFSNCIFQKTTFENCEFKECRFPKAVPKNAAKKLAKTRRAIFYDCSIVNTEIVDADLSSCDFLVSKKFRTRNENADGILRIDKINNSSLAGSKLDVPLRNLRIKGCNLKGLRLYQDKKASVLAMENCTVESCNGLLIQNALVTSCIFQGDLKSPLSLQLEDTVVMKESKILFCNIKMNNGKTEFISNCELYNTSIEGKWKSTAGIEMPSSNMKFLQTIISGCTLKGLVLESKAFNFGHIGKSDVKGTVKQSLLISCFLSGDVLYGMKIGYLNFEACRFDKNNLGIRNSLFEGPIMFKSGSERKRELNDYHINAQNCFDKYSDSNRGFVFSAEGTSINYRLSGSIYQESKVTKPNDQSRIEPVTEIFKERLYSSWASEINLYNEFQGDVLKALWKKELWNLGHEIPAALRFGGDQLRMLDKMDNVESSLDIDSYVKGILENETLRLILSADTFSTLKRNFKKFMAIMKDNEGLANLADPGLELEREKAKICILDSVRCTRLRTSCDEEDSIVTWLNAITACDSIEVVEGEKDYKVYGDFNSLARWIRKVYMHEVNQWANGDFRITVTSQNDSELIRLGDYASQDGKGFVTREREEVQTFLRLPKNGELTAFARSWLKTDRSNENLLSFTTEDCSGRARFVYDGSDWQEAPLLSTDWRKGTYYEIPLPHLE